VQPDRPLPLLSGGLAFGHGLDAMIHRVADQVQQRIGQLMQHPTVQFGVDPSCIPPDVFSLRSR
jgi:hypothetical protein